LSLSSAVTSNESFEIKICSSPKISGLQRSQEQSTVVSFAPPTSSPAPTGSPIPAATATSKSPPPITIKKESTPISNPDSAPHFMRNLSDLQDHKVTPLSHHSQPIISHHHPPATNHLTYGLHDISNSPLSLPPKHPLPPSPAPPLPLSIAALSSPHYPLRSSSHLSPLSRHPAMFAPPAALPPPPALPTNSLVVPGHPAATPYPGTVPSHLHAFCLRLHLKPNCSALTQLRPSQGWGRAESGLGQGQVRAGAGPSQGWAGPPQLWVRAKSGLGQGRVRAGTGQSQDWAGQSQSWATRLNFTLHY
ncbi:autism susceptibility gene 2 protein, partial [Tachysurus ichikawai]